MEGSPYGLPSFLPFPIRFFPTLIGPKSGL